MVVEGIVAMTGRFLSWFIIFALGTFISFTSLWTHLATYRALMGQEIVCPAVPQTHKIRVSWYGPGYYGRRTANGEVFVANKLTAASPDLPFGTLMELCRDGKCIVVRVNDRGPYCEYPGSYYYPCDNPRDMDLSEGAAEALGFKKEGVITLDVRYLYIPEP